MTNKEAIEILTEELHHTEQHLTAKDKAPDYYEELGNYCESVRMAINALTVEARPKGEWGKWVISEIQCPNCLEYFQTDCYSTEELKKCPSCGADLRGGNT